MFSLLLVSAGAQQYQGTLSGTVTDDTGAKIAGATVTATDLTTKFVSKGVTNKTGEYNIQFLQPDNYSVTIESPGFHVEKRTGVNLTAGQIVQNDFSLKAGATDTVIVTADQQLLDTTSANLATTFSTEEVTDTPNIGRNPFVLSTLAAGVYSSYYMQSKASTFTNPFSGAAVQLDTNGSSGHNRLTLDGIPDDPSERFSGSSYTGFVPSPEAVQEVKVQTALYDAEYGHGDGVVTNTVLRAGSNKFHGSAYDVFRNTYMNANTYERVPTQNTAPSGVALTPRSSDQWEQPGGVIDGPVIIPHLYNGRDKTFFMIASEYLQLHQVTPYSSLVPTRSGGLTGKGEIGGDFSSLCGTFNASGVCTSGVQIYDPLSVTSGTGNRTPFPYNLIPTSRFNPTGAALLGYFPAPNSNLSPAVNYISSDTRTPNQYYSVVTRVDHQFSDRQHFDATFFKAVLHQLQPNEGFPTQIGPTSEDDTVYRNNIGGTVEDSYSVSPTLVIDGRLGVIYHPFGLIYTGDTFNLASIGINSAGEAYQSFPGTSDSDSYAGLAAGAGGQISEDTLSSAALVVAKTIRTHSLRMGFEGNLSRYNVQNPQSGLGAFTFNRQFTQENSSGASGASCPAPSCVVGSDPNSGNPVASMLLGYPSSGSYANNIAYALQQKYVAFFVQDDWRATEKLTLNIGVRWDYESPFSERHNRLNAGFCLTCANPGITGTTPALGGLTFVDTPASPSRYSAPQKYGNFQPRFGAAYAVTPKLVARGGIGLIYFNTQNTPLSQGYSQSTSYVAATNSVYPTGSISNPFPSGVQTPTGNSLGLATQLGQGISYPDPNAEQPAMLQYSVSLQYQLPSNIALQVAYVGNRTTRLPVNRNLDYLPASYMGTSAMPLSAAQTSALLASVNNPFAGQLPGSSLNGATVQNYLLDVAYPEFTGVTDDYISIGETLYNALQVTVRKPLSHHFEIQGNLTYSKIMDQNALLNPQSSTLFRYQDSQPNILSNIFGTYHFPELRGKRALLREPFGGWKLQGVLRAYNGSLIGSLPGNEGSQYGTSQTYTQLGNPYLPKPARSYNRYFNTCYQNSSGVNVLTTVNATTGAITPGCDTYSSVAVFRANPEFTLASMGPELNVRELVHPLADASLFKQFQMTEGSTFELRGEFFNVMNTPNFGGPGTTPGSSTYGYVSLTQANDPRLTQLTVRINF